MGGSLPEVVDAQMIRTFALGIQGARDQVELIYESGVGDMLSFKTLRNVKSLRFSGTL